MSKNLFLTNHPSTRIGIAVIVLVFLLGLNAYSWYQTKAEHISITDITDHQTEIIGKHTAISNLRITSTTPNTIIATKQSRTIIIQTSSATIGDLTPTAGQFIHVAGSVSPDYSLAAEQIRYDRIPSQVKFLTSIVALIGVIIMMKRSYQWDNNTHTLIRRHA